MPVFKYYGRNEKGTAVEGKLKAGTEREVRDKLERRKIKPKEVQELTGWMYKEIQLFQRAKTKDLVIFLRQMTTLIQAGVSIVDSIRLLGEQTKQKLWREAFQQIEEEVRAGKEFSATLESHRNLFPALLTNMIKAGEAGGNIDEVMERLAVYYEKQHQLKQKVISAITYPVILAVISLGVVLFLLAVVVPSFASMFAGFGAELPLITRFVLASGDFLTTWIWLLIPVIGLVIAAVVYAKRDPNIGYYLDLLLLRTPIIGGVLQKAAIARMSRTWASLFQSSVPVLQATAIVERVVGNEVLARVIRESRVALERGESIATPMEEHWIFPPLVTQMVVVGEKTGALDKMFEKVADFYETEVDQSTERLKSLLEPLLIAFMAVIVGTIVASIAIPMFEIFETIQ
ncbi:type II secretion system F family protein [Paenalkalicoccus suaedae]|uniref:Type II secretion system F family protein n=1 Tax=Paenalkalicoccus suaedae TaxID=2592382 RepID=A0A859FFH0_9BACI|nr:type II secretion system F family protein [Paenalkalicoccus suaedae]QKS71857.1 type II secretion system F family protein [Paenalkalicoccus suaedae]